MKRRRLMWKMKKQYRLCLNLLCRRGEGRYSQSLFYTFFIMLFMPCYQPLKFREDVTIIAQITYVTMLIKIIKKINVSPNHQKKQNRHITFLKDYLCVIWISSSLLADILHVIESLLTTANICTSYDDSCFNLYYKLELWVAMLPRSSPCGGWVTVLT